MMEAKITLPTGTEVQLPFDLWKTASYVATIDTPGGIAIVPVLLTTEAPEKPVVYGVFVLPPATARRFLRDLDAMRAQKPSWLHEH